MFVSVIQRIDLLAAVCMLAVVVCERCSYMLSMNEEILSVASL